MGRFHGCLIVEIREVKTHPAVSNLTALSKYQESMRLFTAVLFLLAAFGSVFAQSAGNETASSNAAEPGTRISGKVTDETGAVVFGVRIVATGNDGQTYQTASNSEGRFDLAVPFGNYRIEFSLYGFSGLHLTNFSVPSTSQNPITAVLQHDPNIIIHDDLFCFGQVDNQSSDRHYF